MRTAIFDFDGTIADSLHVMQELYNRIAPSYGCKPVPDADLPRLQGSRPQQLMKAYGVRWYVLPFLARKMRAAFRAEVGRAAPQPGVVDAIRALHAEGMTLGILSSNTVENIRPFLEAHGIAEHFSFVESCTSLFGKHRAFTRLMKKRRIAQDDVIYVGDETRDVEAAKRAGIRVAAVTWGFQTADALAAAKPDALISRPEELQEFLKNQN